MMLTMLFFSARMLRTWQRRKERWSQQGGAVLLVVQALL